MKRTHDLSAMPWKVAESFPYLWQFQPSATLAASPDLHPIPARVPGSVQRSLLDAGQIPDWNNGLDSRACEWVENRHWLYETRIPAGWVWAVVHGGKGDRALVRFQGLDYSGWIWVNGRQVAEFRGSHVPHVVDITAALGEGDAVLRVVFDHAPRWLGQFGRTSRMLDWKPRYNYTWDWIPRNVQVGVSGRVHLIVQDALRIEGFRCLTDAAISQDGRITGALGVQARVPAGLGTLHATLHTPEGVLIREETLSAARMAVAGLAWADLDVKAWWPNRMGEQPLYTFRLSLKEADGKVHDLVERRVGFRNVRWKPCEGAPAGSEPWVCVVNGREVFLAGVNYPPLSPYWADVSREDHRKRLAAYRDIGMNILRLNACGILESEDFYDLCDEMGLMVWQEMPLTSSGVENTPPAEPLSVAQLESMAVSFVERRVHHASLILWGGGNELVDANLVPYDATHPTLAALKRVFESEDPTRRFVPCSPSGPRFGMAAKDFGRGVHHDVHGPWKPEEGMPAWTALWEGADALFHSELGCPGASPAPLIRRYQGNLDPMPIDFDNPLWRNPISWWLEIKAYREETGRDPERLEDYVSWSQARQARALGIAVSACRKRFPRCGGVILWTGHDCFPCPTNTSILDFHGDPKPAALELARILRA